MKMCCNILLFITLCLCSCKGRNNTSTPITIEASDSLKTFTMPEMPAMLTEPEQQADFLTKHYWDNFNFADTVYAHQPKITGQAWINYIDILFHVPTPMAQNGMKILMNKAQASRTMFNCFIKLADEYLYNPNSTYRNEEFYIPVLEAMIASPLLDEAEKSRPAFRLELALKNRMGHKANDLTYTLKSGKQGTLYQLKSEYTLLYFNNPGCHACEEITAGLKQSMRIQYLLNQKQLIILAVYPDEDLNEWHKHMHDFPADWINGYNKGVVLKEKNVYDLKAIPTLYLLDKNKVVLLKDTTLPVIEQYLREREGGA